MILTDEKGVPFERPQREDYPDAIEWMRAVYAHNDRVSNHANREFAEAFREAIGAQRPVRVAA